MDIAIQALGSAGLVGTVVEFTYVLITRGKFTPFEEVFFLMSGCVEMLGEVLFLLMGITVFLREKDCNGFLALMRDPVHNVAKRVFDRTAQKRDEESEEYVTWSLIALLVSVLSVPVWATFWPVWGDSFDDDGDGGLRLALSICSLGFFFAVALARQHEPSRRQVFTCILLLMYAMQKVFEVCILLSNIERLCPDNIGKGLVALQLTEILSVAFIFACIAWAYAKAYVK